MKILVTGANGDIGEAIGRILISAFPDGSVTGSDCGGAWPGGFVFPRMLAVPPASDPEYLGVVRELAAQYDLIIPTSEPELERLSQPDVSPLNVPLLMVEPRILQTFMDKFATAQFFERHGIDCPRTQLLRDATPGDLPLHIKPRRGAGGRGHRRVTTEAELRAAREQLPGDWVAQEYLAGEGNEYTCAVSRFDGRTRYLILRRKLQGDRTVVAEVSSIPQVGAMLDQLGGLMQLEGCINVQLKMTARGPMVFEINPRLSSTVMMRHVLGFHDCVWWVRRKLGLSQPDYDQPADGRTVYRMSVERIRPWDRADQGLAPT